jgi:hypothetical protein
MKRILAPIILLTLLFPALAFGETIDDLVITNGLYYKKYTDVPFTGKTMGKIQRSFKDGKEHGPWVSYHDNGQVFSQGTYKNGKWDGPYISYHDNGQLWSKGTFKDGMSVGPWFSYNEYGRLKSKETYKDGVKVD